MTVLGDAAWPDLGSGERRTLLVPVGSVEQHGPHLPLDTDTRIATAVATRVAASTDVLLGPAIAYGASGEHETFPGTVSLGTDALRSVLVELGRSACRWAERVVFVNGHGGNTEALVAAVTLLRAESRDVSWFPCAVPGGDAHAGHTETSLLLALQPEVVRRDAAEPGATAPLTELLLAMRAGSVRAVSANGVLGDPTGATAEHGRVLFDTIVDGLRAALGVGHVDPRGRLMVA